MREGQRAAADLDPEVYGLEAFNERDLYEGWEDWDLEDWERMPPIGDRRELRVPFLELARFT